MDDQPKKHPRYETAHKLRKRHPPQGENLPTFPVAKTSRKKSKSQEIQKSPKFALILHKIMMSTQLFVLHWSRSITASSRHQLLSRAVKESYVTQEERLPPSKISTSWTGQAVTQQNLSEQVLSTKANAFTLFS
ncbi:hypothetical protein AVEN_43261-1 [Araneus ventricosus]|uniref:Uncharacterized protein n=1 Tax=Araneus ventricosus TaxID=182803 RepID=A0A4Y2GGG2_ARAVE|nr:hypothetical protein AVEN_43261-1 [Araneus ventricosus]